MRERAQPQQPQPQSKAGEQEQGWEGQAVKASAKELSGARTVSNEQWEEDNGAALVTEEEQREVAAATAEAAAAAAAAAAAMAEARTLSMEGRAKVRTPLGQPA